MAWHTVVIHHHIRCIFLVNPADAHRFAVNRILLEIMTVKLFSKRIEPRHMELPRRMLLLQLVVNCCAVDVFHRDQDQIQLIRQLFVNILC